MLTPSDFDDLIDRASLAAEFRRVPLDGVLVAMILGLKLAVWETLSTAAYHDWSDRQVPVDIDKDVWEEWEAWSRSRS